MGILIIALIMAVSLMSISFYSLHREHRASMFNSLKASNRVAANSARFAD